MSELLDTFQAFRTIYCVCPCCNNLMRLSDIKLEYEGEAPLTWLDKYEECCHNQDRAEEKFDEIEEKLREKSVEKGRKEAEEAFNKAICPSLRACRLDPFDIKPILNPVDFVAFKGMNKNGNVSDIIFLSNSYNNAMLNKARLQVKNAIQNKKYDWQVARISEIGDILFE